MRTIVMAAAITAALSVTAAAQDAKLVELRVEGGRAVHRIDFADDAHQRHRASARDPHSSRKDVKGLSPRGRSP